MKCKNCDGDGVIVDVEYGHAGKYGCKYCDGKGVVEPLTNEEWLKSANTEQLADKLTDFSFWLVPNLPKEDKREQVRKWIVNWLKEIHK